MIVSPKTITGTVLRDYLACLGVLAACRDQGARVRMRWLTPWGHPARVEIDVDDDTDIVSVLESDLSEIRGDGGEPDPYLEIPKLLDIGTEDFGRLASEYIARGDRAGKRSLSWLSVSLSDFRGELLRGGLHLLSGQQEWMAIARRLAHAVGHSDLTDALFGSASRKKLRASFRWGIARPGYAYAASDPAETPEGCVPGLEWLAFRGLTMLRPAGRWVLGCNGLSGSSYTYPLWSHWATSDEVASMVGASFDAHGLVAGDVAVVRVRVERDQYGYGYCSVGDVSPPLQRAEGRVR